MCELESGKLEFDMQKDIDGFLNLDSLYGVLDGHHEIDVMSDLERYIAAFAFSSNETLLNIATHKLQRSYNDYLEYYKRYYPDKDLLCDTILECIANPDNWRSGYSDYAYRDLYYSLFLIFDWCIGDFAD